MPVPNEVTGVVLVAGVAPGSTIGGPTNLGRRRKPDTGIACFIEPLEADSRP